MNFSLSPLPGGLQGVFDYFIRDNLSNIRAVITEEVNQASSTCTMETDNATVQQGEEALFGHPVNNEVSGTRIATNLTPWTANTSAQVSKLVSVNGNTTIGPNVLLKVMAGDVVGTHVAYYYDQDPGSSSSGTDGLQALAGALVNSLTIGAAGSLAQHEAAAIGSSLGGLPGTDALPGFFTSQPGSGSNTAAPRAYLNYLFFDEQFRFVGATSGSRRVSMPATPGTLDMGNVKAVQNGYVLVYVSNASAEPVYFDDLSVAHARSPLIEENHYYAFGLKIASISSKAVASTLNPNAVSRGYQGAYSEEINDLELNYNEFDLRLYDPQIGRWNSVDPYDEFPSPYTGMGNDPVSNVDPRGGSVYKPEIFRSLLAGGSGAVSSSLGATVSGAMSAVGQGLATLAIFGASAMTLPTPDGGTIKMPDGVSNISTFDAAQRYTVGGNGIKPVAGSVQGFSYNGIDFTAQYYTADQSFAYYLGTDGSKLGYDINTLANNIKFTGKERLAFGGALFVPKGANPYMAAGGAIIGTAAVISSLYHWNNVSNDFELSRPFASTYPTPALPLSIPYSGSGNRYGNTDPHMVYEIFKDIGNGNRRTLKYGITDFLRFGYERPEAQLPAIFAMYGSGVGYRPVLFTPNRASALAAEQALVDAYWLTNGAPPPLNFRPIPTPLKK